MKSESTPIFIDTKAGHTLIKVPPNYYRGKEYSEKNTYKCDCCLKQINEKNAFFIEVIIPKYMDLTVKYYCEECGNNSDEYINYMFEKIK